MHLLEITGNEIKKLNGACVPGGSKAYCMFDKKSLDYNHNEIDKFGKITNEKTFIYISCAVPRRNPGYDAKLYKPVLCGEAALSYDDWIKGETKDPIVKDINTIENKWVQAVEEFVKKEEVKIEPTNDKEKIAQLEQRVKELENANNTLKLEVEKYQQLLKEETKKVHSLEAKLNDVPQPNPFIEKKDQM